MGWFGSNSKRKPLEERLKEMGIGPYSPPSGVKEHCEFVEITRAGATPDKAEDKLVEAIKEKGFTYVDAKPVEEKSGITHGSKLYSITAKAYKLGGTNSK